MLAQPHLLSARNGLPARNVQPLQHTPAARAHCHSTYRYRASERMRGRSSSKEDSKLDTQSQQEGAQGGASTPFQREGMAASQGNSGIVVQGYSPTSIKGWNKIKSTLREANVKLLSAQELTFARERGVPIIDIRPPADYEQAHIPGAQNVPFYQPITGGVVSAAWSQDPEATWSFHGPSYVQARILSRSWYWELCCAQSGIQQSTHHKHSASCFFICRWSAMKIARRAGYALFGVLNGTEVNQEFTQQVAKAMKPDSGAIIYCSIGGSLDPVEKSKKGLQSRSLIAAWKLVTDGYPNVSVLKGGWSEWINSEREVAGGTD